MAAVPPPPSHLVQADVHLRDLVAVVYKRRRLVITVVLLTLLAGLLHVLLTPPVFEGRTQLLIEKEAANVVSFKQAFEQNQNTDDYYQTQYRLLHGRDLARRTMDTLMLWQHPQFTDAKAVAAPERSAGQAPDEGTLPPEKSRAVTRFLADLSVTPVRNSRLVDLHFRSKDPALAARVANTLARTYIQQNLEVRSASSKEASDWLASQLEEQRQKVDASERAVHDYLERTGSVALEDKQNIVVQKLADLNAAVTRVKTERLQKEAAYSQIRTLQSDPAALFTLPAVVSNTFLQQQRTAVAELERQRVQMAEQFGPRHPDMVKLDSAIDSARTRVQAEIVNITESLRHDYEQALAQEQSLARSLDAQGQDALALNQLGIEYGALAREAASNRQIFESLLQRTKETGISGDLRTSNIRIVEQADVPERPVSPNRRNTAIAAMSGGLLLALGLAFFFEYLDDRIETPADLRRHLGLSFLGLIPKVAQPGASLLLASGAPAEFSESIRAVRTGVMFGAGSTERRVVVTSTGPGEGKSVVAANLAQSLAQLRQRVVLLDADLRRPRAHELLGVDRGPGLAEVLSGSVPLASALRVTSVPGLLVLPAGAAVDLPAELIGSPQFEAVLQQLTAQDSWVVIDTPPVGAVTDASMAARLAGGILFVVGAGMTSRHMAQRAIEQLRQSGARFTGAVLNRVDVERNPYTYSRDYRPEYSRYYDNAAS